jgi:alcohol dehydrogenase
MIDPNANRLAVARDLGATHTLSGSAPEIIAAVKKLTDGKGADSVIEAVGTPTTFELCEELVAPGGVIANIGVHGKKRTCIWKRCGRTISPSARAWSIPSQPIG